VHERQDARAKGPEVGLELSAVNEAARDDDSVGVPVFARCIRQLAPDRGVGLQPPRGRADAQKREDVLVVELPNGRALQFGAGQLREAEVDGDALVCFLLMGCERQTMQPTPPTHEPSSDERPSRPGRKTMEAPTVSNEIRSCGLLSAEESSSRLGLDRVVNPYDPDEVRVDVEITFPDGSTRTPPAFWYVQMEPFYVARPSEDGTRTVEWERFRPTGDGTWRFRFLPQTEGEYTWNWSITHNGEHRTLDGGALRVSGPPAEPGGITLRRGELYFRRTNGSPFYPIGENLGWPEEAGSRIYAEWLRKLSEAGGNAARLWLVHYMCGTALEWSAKEVNPGFAVVGRYSQESAARVDAILDAAGRTNVFIMLSFYAFGDTNWDWKNNPYSVHAGGWLEEPREFFADDRALQAVKARLRYAVARYGWSPNVWAWELWNEVETSSGCHERSVTRWHDEMAAYLKEIDIHSHLVTTSYRFTPPTTPCAAFGLGGGRRRARSRCAVLFSRAGRGPPRHRLGGNPERADDIRECARGIPEPLFHQRERRPSPPESRLRRPRPVRRHVLRYVGWICHREGIGRV
jgi:hypothetical protein